MKIILIGIQGAGKSTQGNLLSEKLKIPYLSTGHIFREMAKEKTSLGRYIKEIMNAGYLIPDAKTVEIVGEYLKKAEYANGYILDGFPRTLDQVKKFENGVDRVVYLRVSDKEALWRLSYRNGENGEARQDETLAAIRRRIELFHQLTEPVLNYYREKGALVEVDGERPVEKIREEILKKVKS
ncbi:MAG: adk, adenylate kinase, adenylate kinase [Candidatus Levybacteria bacterium]|nr:adk, adenylate kinase, adenylate kinase [Candidatus Levybacteria bacterium]